MVKRMGALRDAEKLRQCLPPLPEPVDRTVFIVVSGLPGVGKSYVSRRLAGKLPLVVLESDALRQALFRNPGYSAAESARLFEAIHLLIEDLLEKGVSVVLDATSLVERHRQVLYAIADRTGARLIVVRVDAPATVVRQRLEARTKGDQDHSEADWRVYQMMKPTAEPIRRRHIVVDTSKDITPVVDRIVRLAKQRK